MNNNFKCVERKRHDSHCGSILNRKINFSPETNNFQLCCCSNISKVFGINRLSLYKEMTRKEEKEIGQSAIESRGRDHGAKTI